MSCGNDCDRPAGFPARIRNRPGLARIGYRIGDYASFRDHMLRQLDLSGPLQAWTHRGADDPGIALLEGAALVAEVIAFYQSLYANEAFLRTAAWSESVSRLVQLTGYRPAPGVGGEASFAVMVEGDGPVTIPAGYGIRVSLEGRSEAAVFETRAEHLAWPAQNRFHLYAPPGGPVPIEAGLDRLDLVAVDGERGLARRRAQLLGAGDRLLLLPPDPWFSGGSGLPGSSQAPAETLLVRDVETRLDRVEIRFEGALGEDRGMAVTARPVGRSFRHFGHAAPARFGGEVDPDTGIQEIRDTGYLRRLDADTAGEAGVYSNIGANQVLLDGEVEELPVGGYLVCQGFYRLWIFGPRRFTVLRRIRSVRPDTGVWAGVTGPCTLVELDRPLIDNPYLADAWGDLRQLRFLEVTGPALTLEAPRPAPTGDLAQPLLYCFGRHCDALALAGRELMLRHDDGRLQTLSVVSRPDADDLAQRDAEDDWMWPLTLSEVPAFPAAAFDREAPRVTVYGNLLHADQGETQAETVLGSGDARQAFQTFRLPKAPLTWLLQPDATPAQVPELMVYVDGLLWRQVDVLFGQDPKARVYVVRQDEAGDSHVQFGDGRTGARLPSGRDNVVALYRVGTGAHGPAAGDPSPLARVTGVQAIEMPGPAVGGGDPESADGARRAAPLRLQSLDRLVGLSDYEAETLALPGVIKARAEWLAPAGAPQVRVTVLTEGGDPADAVRVQQGLDRTNRCRGAARFPVRVRQARRRWLFLSLVVGYRAGHRAEAVEAAVRQALGVAGEEPADRSGLFATAARELGQGAHLSQVLAAVQNLDGVAWARADGFQALEPAGPDETDPLALEPPPSPQLVQAIGCPGDRLLALHPQHLQLLLSRDSASGECRT